MNKTTAPGSSAGQFVDDNPGGGIVGTLIVAADQNAHQDEVYNAITGSGLTPSAADNGQLWDAIRKAIKERSRELGEIFDLPAKKAPVAFGPGTEDTYFPAYCLSDFDSYKDVSVANYPNLIDYLRAIKLVFKDGLAGEISAFGVTNWAIAANVATLTFTNDADHIAFLTALNEDQNLHGGFSNWKTFTLPNSIGIINAGTYAISAINAGARTISFPYVASNGSGIVTSTAEFYPHRIAGSTTTAREWSLKGLSLIGANDANGYFVSGGLRRRGFLQGHTHSYAVSSGGSAPCFAASSSAATDTTGVIKTVSTDGTNGTPRTGKETHSPSAVVHWHRHAGIYLP